MNKELQKIGQQLKSCREAKNIELSALSDKIKINVSFLSKIEDGIFDFLPKPYVRAFLRTFAHEVGLDPDVVVADYNEALTEKKPQLIQDVVKESQEKSNQREEPHLERDKDSIEQAGIQSQRSLWHFLELKSVRTAGAVVCLFMVMFVAVLRPGKHFIHEKDLPVEEIPLESGHQVVDSTAVIAKYELAPQPQDTTLRLTITASETTWMRITIDDLVTDECIFTPGDVRTWDGKDKFGLRLGNGGGVFLALNNKSLGVPGVSGRIAQVVVTENGLQPLRQSIQSNGSSPSR